MNLEELAANAEAKKAVEEALDRNADAKELVGILAGAGLDEDAAEELVSQFQQKRGAKIGAQELDDDTLDQVAGGGYGFCERTADCDKQFMRHPEIEKDDRCYGLANCDELLFGGCAD